MATFYEFFAGGGMARAGLGEHWNCLFANDFDVKKAESYKINWGASDLAVEDIAHISVNDLPQNADLAWASSPCQDLSLAGNYKGLGSPNSPESTRSGTFWKFWTLIEGLNDEGRAPKIIVFENVVGTLTSHEGKDFAAIADAFASVGYKFGAQIIDASHFVPQSRKRLFVVGIREDLSIPDFLVASDPNPHWHPVSIKRAYSKISTKSKRNWIWWNLPAPPRRRQNFIDILEEDPKTVKIHSAKETSTLLGMMSKTNLQKVKEAMEMRKPIVGGVYKRVRKDSNGNKIQRAEVRFDKVAGCLRTPSGGSSRQVLLLVNGSTVRSRLLSPREAARLMGLPDTYILPQKYNDAYHLTGDGVVVQVVRFLAKNIFEPILAYQLQSKELKPILLLQNV